MEESQSIEFDTAAERLIELGNRLLDEDDESDSWEVASGLLAGAISMAAGEYISMKAQNELIERELEVERRSIAENLSEETEELIDMAEVVSEALKRAETAGIVFIDEIDKIASGDVNRSGAEVSREGVQRDLLPIVEGAAVSTRYGTVHTDHILFVAAGAFHAVRPSELAPELQGRFPIRVELNALGEEDLCRILTEPRGALIDQYAALLAADGVGLRFSPDAIRAVARCAYEANMASENMGARRLRSVLSTLLEDVLFDAPALPKKKIYITNRYVAEKLGNYLEGEDLSRYVL